jgi:hypothetical protein
MSKVRIALVVALVAALAAVGAGWKWRTHSAWSSQGEYRIAGWTWGDEQAQLIVPHGEDDDQGENEDEGEGEDEQ